MDQQSDQLELYDVVFVCYWADYYWKVEEGLLFEEATNKTNEMNKNGKIHRYNGCCHYLIQKQS